VGHQSINITKNSYIRAEDGGLFLDEEKYFKLNNNRN